MRSAPLPIGSSTSGSSPQRAKKVFVIDDYADTAETLCALLSILGYDARWFQNPLVALSCLDEFQPDVCISDINMPDMNGYQFARAVRANPDFKNTLLIALTSYTWPEHQEAAFAAGFDEHLSKSAHVETLKNLLGTPQI
jgi:CheY-like chemotaxis protein